MAGCKLWKVCSGVSKRCAGCEEYSDFRSYSYNNVTVVELLVKILAELEKMK